MASHTTAMAAASSGDDRSQGQGQQQQFEGGQESGRGSYRGGGWYYDSNRRWQRTRRARPEWTAYGTGRKQDTVQLSCELNHHLRGHTREAERLVRNGYFDRHFYIDVDELLAGTPSLRNWDPWVRDWILYIVKK